MNKPLQTIGRAERIELLDAGFKSVPAKIDTGADSSSIWVTEIQENADGLRCKFFGPESDLYTGAWFIFAPGDYKITRVANSFGQQEIRYKVKLRIKVHGRTIRATFTLSNRSNKTYPILLGRRLLAGKFVVDVSAGEPLRDIEKAKARALAEDLEKLRQERKKS